MKKEKASSIQPSGETLKRVLSYIKPYRINLILSLLFALLSVGTQLVVPILTGSAIDEMIGKGAVDFDSLGKILLIIGVSIAVTSLSQWVMNECNNRMTFSVSRDMRSAAIEKIQKLPLSYLDSHPTGDLVSRVISDVDVFTDGLLMGFTQLFSGVLTIIGTVGFMLYINIPITIAVIVITPLSILTAGFIAYKSEKYFRRQSQIRGSQTALINEMVEGNRVIKAFGQQKKVIESFDEINEQLRQTGLRAVFYSSITNPVTRFVNSMVYAAVTITGAFSAIKGGISIGQLSSFLSYANQYTKPFNEISGVVTELQNALTCASRLFQLLDEKEEIPDSPDAISLSPEDVTGQVEIKNVNFSYSPERPLIENMNLTVKPGQHIAIVGPTGCGKTTLINLLMRFYDVNSGSISISGHEIKNLTRSSLRSAYGMVLQDTWLKRGTIRENIAYGKPDATMEEIVEAAKRAHAHSFITRLPGRYDSIVTEDGGNLSQGQKQLLCIARVMLYLPPMLILDEATSSIDTRTELQIQDAFGHMMAGRTSFIVAHRLSTIREADMILVMKDGHIIEHGTHESLLALGGFYHTLYNSQFENADGAE